MLWLIVIISALFLQAIAALVDKYLLKSHIPSAKVYAFYVGIFSIAALVFIPLGFSVSSLELIVLDILAGAFFLFGLYVFYSALSKFEVSRIIPAIGGITPLFVFILVYFLYEDKSTMGIYQVISFILLLLGSILIVYDKDKLITFKSFQFSALAAFLFSISYILFKFAYETQAFWSAFIWINIGSFLIGILFLLSKEVRDEIFRKKHTFKKDTGLIFMANRLVGSSSYALQNWAIALVPFGFLAFLNAMEGIRYIFILIFAAIISIKFPKILSEEISRKIILQKFIAVLLIVAGLVILVL